MLGCSWEFVLMSVAVLISFCGVYVRTDKTLAAMASCRYPMEAQQGACGCSSSLVAACSSWYSVSALILLRGRDTNRHCKLWLKWPVSLPQRRRSGIESGLQGSLTKSTEEGNITGARSVRLLGIYSEQWLTKGAVAPPKHQKFLSYTVGYLCVLGWHAGLAETCYAAGQQVQAIIVLANPNYTIHTWQTALLACAVIIIAVFFNTVLFRKLPILEGILIFAHVFGFCAFVVVLWYV